LSDKYIINYVFKQILKYINLKRWENFSSLTFLKGITIDEN